ncbi:MAG: cytochrome b, partial [Hyphomicrobiaceae bacterium]
MAPIPTAEYSGFAKFLHWTMALAVIIALILGVIIANLNWGPVKSLFAGMGNQLYDLHRSFGALLLALIVIRIAWRLISPPPPLPDTIKPWQKTASHLVHMGLYTCLAAMPLLGWVGTSLYGAKITVFGLFVLPAIVDKDRPASGLVLDFHGWIGFALIALITVHIGAALM